MAGPVSSPRSPENDLLQFYKRGDLGQPFSAPLIGAGLPTKPAVNGRAIPTTWNSYLQTLQRQHESRRRKELIQTLRPNMPTRL